MNSDEKTELIPDEDLVAVVHLLVDSVNEFNEKGGKFDRRTRRITRILGCTLIIDILLTAGVAFSTHRANTATKRLHTVQVSNCIKGNQRLEKDKALWLSLLSLPKAPGQAPTPPNVAQAFIDNVNSAFQPTDCTKIR